MIQSLCSKLVKSFPLSIGILILYYNIIISDIAYTHEKNIHTILCCAVENKISTYERNSSYCSARRHKNLTDRLLKNEVTIPTIAVIWMTRTV